MTAIILGSVGALIYLLNYYATYYSNQGILKDSDFLLYYLKHEMEINIILLSMTLIFLLFLFVRLFFQNLEILIDTMQGNAIEHFPMSYRYLPEIELARKRILDMLEKKQRTQQLSIEEKEHKNELLMYLAHDLKTPLTSMIGYINHIIDHKVDDLQRSSSIQIAYEKAQRLDDLIDEFSEILRYDDKVSQLDLTKINIPSMLHQQIAGFYPLIEKKGIHLNLNFEENVEIYGDFDKLHRVFDNLMRNAINYCIPHTDISICVQKQKEGVLIEYTNEKEAMDAESVHHLFDKFYRAESARSSTSGGAGLGLAIAREIIELHQGNIHADIKGKTITFYVFLPFEQKVMV